MTEPDFQAALGQAIQEVINTSEDSGIRGVVTKWVVVAEVMSGEDKSLHAFRADRLVCPVWDAKGMLRAIADDPDMFDNDEA